MKKFIAILVSAVMVFALAATAFAGETEVTWADYQQYLIDTAGSNAPDLQEFTDQVMALGSWEDIDQTVSPWDQMFTTIGLSTWEEFAAGEVKEALVPAGENMGGGDSASAEGESAEGESPKGESAEGESPEGETPAGESQNVFPDDMTASSFATNDGDTSRPQDEGKIYVGYAITDGALDAENSNWETEDPSNIELNAEIDGIGFTAVRVEGESDVNVTGYLGVFDDSDGQVASDFTGTGVAITGYNGANITADGVTYESHGFSRSFAIVQNASLTVKNSNIIAHGNDPLLNAWDGYYNSANTSMMISPPWVLGIQGGIRTINVLGQGSSLIVEDSDITAGGWGVLSTDGCDTPYLWLFNSSLNITPQAEGGMNSGSAIFGYDEAAYGSGYGTYLIGGAEEYFYGMTINGATYTSILTGGDGFYQGIKAGETYTMTDAQGNVIGEYTAEADVPTTINTVFGFMAHNSGSMNVLDGTVVNTAESTALYKSANSTWTFSGAELNPGNGIIFQMIDNDDSTVGGFNPFNTYLIEEAGFPTEGYADAVAYVFTTDTVVDPNKTYYTSDTEDESGYAVVENPTDEGTVAYYEKSTGGNNVEVNFENGDYKGDIYNATGYYAQAADALTVTIAADASLTGDIALASHVHGIFLNGRSVDDVIAAIDEANAYHANVGGYYADTEDIEYVFIDANGIVTENKDEAVAIQFTKFSTIEYYLLGHVLNMVNYNGLSSIDVKVEGSWTPANASLVTYLNIAEGAEVHGELTELEDGSILITPAEGLIEPGEYGKAFIYVEAPASSGASSGGESAEGESAEGESAEGESAEGESAEGESPEGESAEGEAASGGSSLEPQTEEYEITVGDVTDIAHYEDLEADSEKRAFKITFDGKEYTGKIDKGVWTADDPEGEEVIKAYQAAHEADPNFQGAPPSAADDAAASEDDMLQAYKDYMNEWLLAEFEINDTMTEEQLPEFQACIEANDYSQFPGDMFFNGMLNSGTAMTYEEFVAAAAK